MNLLLSHFLLGISFAVPMGPVNFEIVRRGIGQGFWHAWLVSLGAMSADFVFLLMINLGMSAWISIPWIHISLTWLGALFMLKLGWDSLKNSFAHQSGEMLQIASVQSTKWHAYGSGMLISFMNPISFLFWLSVYGSMYGTLVQHYEPQMVLVCIVFLFLGIALWNINVASTVHFSRRFLHEKAIRVITFVTGLILLGFGCKFLWQGIVDLCIYAN